MTIHSNYRRCLAVAWFAPLFFTAACLLENDSPPPDVEPVQYNSDVIEIQGTDEDTPVVAYDYFPEQQVYYNRDTHIYTYMKDGRWQRSGYPPDDVREKLKDNYVEVRLKGDVPERYHDEIKHDYPEDTKTGAGKPDHPQAERTYGVQHKPDHPTGADQQHEQGKTDDHKPGSDQNHPQGAESGNGASHTPGSDHPSGDHAGSSAGDSDTSAGSAGAGGGAMGAGGGRGGTGR